MTSRPRAQTAAGMCEQEENDLMMNEWITELLLHNNMPESFVLNLQYYRARLN